jgi:hypothetical protein
MQPYELLLFVNVYYVCKQRSTQLIILKVLIVYYSNSAILLLLCTQIFSTYTEMYDVVSLPCIF